MNGTPHLLDGAVEITIGRDPSCKGSLGEQT